jgi:hypothetical protein
VYCFEACWKIRRVCVSFPSFPLPDFISLRLRFHLCNYAAWSMPVRKKAVKRSDGNMHQQPERGWERKTCVTLRLPLAHPFCACLSSCMLLPLRMCHIACVVAQVETQPNNIRWKVQIMKCCASLRYFSQSSCYFCFRAFWFSHHNFIAMHVEAVGSGAIRTIKTIRSPP